MSGHFHITPLGGAAGDLFGIEMLDAFPEFINPVITGTIAVPPHRSAKLSQCTNAVIAERNSTVPEQNETAPIKYPDMDGILKAADLADAPQQHARAMLRLLAEVEAKAHDMPLNQVHFDEITDWDTLTAASVSIELLDRWNWSIDPPSLGRATERTWHGLSHVPAPATAHLLSGLTAQDDGIGGEPITPPEAAIIRYIVDHITLRSMPMGRFQATGYCAGTRVPPGMFNVVVVRVICGAAQSRDTVEVFEWDIDDMIGEEIAEACNLLALIRLRIGSGLDDTGRQKGRPITGFRIMAQPDLVDAVSQAASDQTATLGLRRRNADRLFLPREVKAGVNVAVLPTGAPMTTESDTVADQPTLAARWARTQEASQ